MSVIAGKVSRATYEVSVVDTIIPGINEYSLSFAMDVVDTTEMSIDAPEGKTHALLLTSATLELSGMNQTVPSTPFSIGSEYNIRLFFGNDESIYLQRCMYTESASPNKVDGLSLVSYKFIVNTKPLYLTGGNKVLNPTFATPDTKWTGDGTDWTFSENKATHVAGNTTDLLQSVAPLTASKYYLVTFTVSNYANGYVRTVLGYSSGTVRTGNGSYRSIRLATVTGDFGLRPSSNADLAVSNVEVVEIKNYV